MISEWLLGMKPWTACDVRGVAILWREPVPLDEKSSAASEDAPDELTQ